MGRKKTLKVGDTVTVSNFGDLVKGVIIKKVKNEYWVKGEDGTTYPKVKLGKPEKKSYFFIVNSL